MDFFQNIDLLSVGIAVAAIAILGLVIYLNNRRSLTSRTFLLFSAVTVFWSVANYLQSSILNPELSFWLLRLVVFFAVWHAFSIFQLFYVFPKNEFVFSKNYKRYLLPAVAVTSVITLTPLVFENIAEVDFDGRLLTVNNGPAIVLFSTLVVSLVLAAFYLLIKKTIQAKGAEKKQFGWMLAGTLITFALLLIFNFLLPAFFNNPDYIPLGPVFLLPFAVFTFYAISSHNLLDVKVVSTEVVAFFLIIAAFSQILISKSIGQIFFQVFVFILLLIFSVFLIRSVAREVNQREKLEKLSQELKKANARLKELDKLKSDFVSIASHQLRSPLTVIKGYGSMILEGSFGEISKDIKNAVEKIYQSSERLIAFVNDLLDVSRIERGKMQYDFEKADIFKIVSSVVEEFQLLAKKKGLVLELKKEAVQIPPLKLDVNKIRQIILNFTDNAVKYTSKGNIIVNVLKVGESVEIRVKDTGIGIDKKDQDKIFNQFMRINGASAVGGIGAGLGLYVARQIARAHGGRVYVESEGKGSGSTFILRLPIK